MVEDDVNSGELLNLKALAENRAGFARSALFDRVSHLLFEGEGELSPEVRILIDQILTGLITHVESEVRKKVSVRLSTLKTAPHDLTKLLASDEIEIARPILHHSPVLTNEDLIDVIDTKTTDHREAIAKRPVVPAEVSAALAASKEPKVVEALLANMGAAIPRAVFGDLVQLAEKVESVRRPLVGRKDMPKDLAHKMFWFVSAAMRHTILDKFAVDPAELDTVLAEVLVEQDAKAAQRAATKGNWSMGEVNSLIAKLKAGDVPGFTTSLAQVVGVELPVAAKIVADTGGEALAIACKALGADRSQFTTIFLQLDYKRFGQARPIAHVQNVSKIYDLMPREKALAQVSLWNAQGASVARAA
ncbi:MAG: DUF2336 domain-containing protein [Alphaproteobacteria bacterium]|nr:DUF2336 domain-containing protein [Alphaproteobacteria bacterium]